MSKFQQTLQELFKKPVIWFFIVIFAFSNLRHIILIGIIVLLLYLLSKPKNMAQSKIIDVGLQKGKRLIQAIVIIIVLLIIVTQMIVVIPAGMTGVYHLFGKVNDNEVRSGLHLVNPFAHITKMSIRTEEYTMSISQGEGERYGDDSIVALTKEGLKVSLDITVLYHLKEDQAADVFKNLGLDYEEKLIRPQIRTAIREVIATYDAKDIYSEKRLEAQIKILNRLKEEITPRGIELESVLVRNVELPEKLANSIQEKLTAEQEAERYDFVLEREAKEAERKRVEAAGQRDAQQIINESLTDRYLNYLYINQLKDRQGTIYVPTNPSTGLPVYKGL